MDREDRRVLQRLGGALPLEQWRDHIRGHARTASDGASRDTDSSADAAIVYACANTGDAGPDTDHSSDDSANVDAGPADAGAHTDTDGGAHDRADSDASADTRADRDASADTCADRDACAHTGAHRNTGTNAGSDRDAGANSVTRARRAVPTRGARQRARELRRPGGTAARREPLGPGVRMHPRLGGLRRTE
jgi:hypothetical protein